MSKSKTANKTKNTFSLAKLLRLVIIYLIAMGIVIAGMLVVSISVIYPKLPSMDELRNYQPKLPLQVYSADGVVLGQFGIEKRIFVSIHQTPQMLIKAILAAEDERFYKHGGVDYIGIIRAIFNNLTAGHIKSGASTITMQVARNFFLSSQKTYTRKFNEALLSYKIERSLTKSQILELYINQIFLGQRAYGFAEAAITYFGKPLDELSIAEYAMLAGLPKAPSSYNPVVNKARAKDRQMYVLGRMRDLHFITPEQYEVAIKQHLVITKGTLNDSTDAGGYIAEMVREMLYTKFGENIYTHGYRVYTTIDSRMQQAAYRALRDGLLKYDASHGYQGAEGQLATNDNNQMFDEHTLNAAFDNLTDYGDLRVAIVVAANTGFVKARLRNGSVIEFAGKQLDFVRRHLVTGNYKMQIRLGAIIRVHNINGEWQISQLPEVQGAIVALDPNNGAIKSLVGGFDYTLNKFNHVTQATRQPGSSFKPFIYSAALSTGLPADTIIDDTPACYPGGVGGTEWCPRNDDNEFRGSMTLRQGLAQSRNLVTVKLLDKITPQYAIDYVTRFGFDRRQFQPYLTMALGANEVTPLQAAEAFAVFANGGYAVNPYLIQTITDNNGKVLARTSNINIHANPPVIDPRNAYIMNSILQDVARYGTGAKAYHELQRSDIAGKTGTTTDARDVWFDGYTPNLVAITWVGYDTPKSLGAKVYGTTLALPIWINFMRTALASTPEKQLVMPAGIIAKENATWKGNTEFYIDPDYKPVNIANASEAESSTWEPNASAVNADLGGNAGSHTGAAQGDNESAVAVQEPATQSPKNQPAIHRVTGATDTDSDVIDMAPSTTEIKSSSAQSNAQQDAIFNNTAKVAITHQTIKRNAKNNNTTEQQHELDELINRIDNNDKGASK